MTQQEKELECLDRILLDNTLRAVWTTDLPFGRCVESGEALSRVQRALLAVHRKSNKAMWG